MKKITKKGFSLAEVLISIGIVSVIATLGFSITKKNIDNAYNMYVYTGASALTDAILDAEYKKKTNNIAGLTNHLRTLFNDPRPPEKEDYIINARNGISFTIEDLGRYKGTPVFRFTMTTPTKRTKSENNNKHTFVKVFEEKFPTLFVTGTTADRIDLLKFYIYNPDEEENNNPPTYYSFREAACRNLGKSITIDIQKGDNVTEEHLLDCTGITITTRTQGKIQMIRP